MVINLGLLLKLINLVFFFFLLLRIIKDESNIFLVVLNFVVNFNEYFNNFL